MFSIRSKVKWMIQKKKSFYILLLPVYRSSNRSRSSSYSSKRLASKMNGFRLWARQLSDYWIADEWPSHRFHRHQELLLLLESYKSFIIDKCIFLAGHRRWWSSLATACCRFWLLGKIEIRPFQFEPITQQRASCDGSRRVSLLAPHTTTTTTHRITQKTSWIQSKRKRSFELPLLLLKSGLIFYFHKLVSFSTRQKTLFKYTFILFIYK